MIFSDWLYQTGIASGFNYYVLVIFKNKCSLCNYGNIAPNRPDVFCGFYAIHLRHLHIKNNKVNLAVFPDNLDGLMT